MNKKYTYHTVTHKPTKDDIEMKMKDGWEVCGAPEGKKGKGPMIFYFRKEK